MEEINDLWSQNASANIEATMATKSDIDKIMDNFIDETNIKEKIFFDAQIFDAAQAYIKIYQQAKNDIYIVDDYINIDMLNLLKKKLKDATVTIFTRNIGEDKSNKFEVNKFNKQYPTLSLKYATNIHDRFIIIDYDSEHESFYLCGTSSKDAVQKVCTITQFRC